MSEFHIYSGQNDMTFNNIVLFFPHVIDTSNLLLQKSQKVLIIPKNVIDEKRRKAFVSDGTQVPATCNWNQ